MCGIAGILAHKPMDMEVTIKAMAAAVYHRGPDSSGYFIENNIALGHRRLSILDLSDEGHQPMDFKGRYKLVFNGEIYNFIELREELKGKGYRFTSQSDTEVILAAYDRWKEECVHRFNGMWAFALYDSQARTLFCSRDRFGIKPFYYTSQEDFFAFGSEIKQLLPFLPSRSANLSVMMDYLVMGLEEHRPETFFQDIMKLPGGSNLTIDLTSLSWSIKRYYTPSIHKELASLSVPEASEALHGHLTRSIGLRLRSDVKVGTCLSGGLDSSSIAALAARQYSGEEPFNAITAVALQKEKDESDYAASVVAKSGLQWHTTTPGKADFDRELDTIITLQEEPFGSPSIAMQYFVMQKAKETGNTVLLDGQGGDELLLGYERYYPSFIQSLPLMSRPFAMISAARHSRLSFLQLVKYHFYFTNANLRMARLKRTHSHINHAFLELTDFSVIKELAAASHDIRELQIMELTRVQLPHLLRYEDKNSMHFSIEARLPFLDYKLAEFCLSVNNNLKIRNGWTKWLMRESMQGDLPPEIAWRKAKIGFEAPEELWLDRPSHQETICQSAILGRIFKTLSLQNLNNRSFWRMLNVAKWEHIYGIKSLS